MDVLGEMLTPDMLKYCQDHHLLESLIVNASSSPVGAESSA
jgi:hypothetical protein